MIFTAKCAALSVILPSKVSYPNSNEYTTSNTNYWSLGADLDPSCIVFPTSTADVSEIMKSLVLLSCHFAVKSGGHMPNPGAANIDSGVTIDLSKLNAVSVAQDRQTVSIGTGARWIDVYETLDQLGLAAAGGRCSSVGVGGLTLGGTTVSICRLEGSFAYSIRRNLIFFGPSRVCCR